MENPMYKWMMTRGTPYDLGNLHIGAIMYNYVFTWILKNVEKSHDSTCRQCSNEYAFMWIYTVHRYFRYIYIYTQDIANMCGHKLIGLNRRGMHMTQQGQNSFDQSVAKGSTL